MLKLTAMRRLSILCSLLFALAGTTVHAQVFTGMVLDSETHEPIVFAEIYFPELQSGTLADEMGVFTIEPNTMKNLRIRISYVGYKPLEDVIDFTKEKSKTFYLEESHYQLEEVVVSAPVGKLQRETVTGVEHLKVKTLQQVSPTTLAEAISNIPGVEQNSTGVGIGKPVIRGLSGSRIVTYAQGIRIENQQWGDEHGLGVGEIGIQSVEVIKGPASLLYGADALGGVLYFIDERYARENSIEASAHSSFLSNTLGSVNDLGFKINKSKIKFNLFAGYASHADYQVPDGRRVFNTRFDEKNLKAALGFNTSNWISNLRYSFLQNDFGIAEEAAYVDKGKRHFTLPFQLINNHALSFENSFFIGESKIQATLGYTANYRREFEDDSLHPALGLHLNTFTWHLKWNSPVYKDFFSFVLGTQGMEQQNANDGEEVLIPDAHTRDAGIFGLMNAEFKQIQLQAGLRFDNRNIETFVTDNIPAFEHAYQGVSFSAGAVYKREKVKLRFNLSTGFRAPNTSELLSDGVHEGTNRYEKGNELLTSEKATQIDFSTDYSGEHLQLSVNPFYTSLGNYIFLSPTDTVIDGNPVFEYLQKDAMLYGGEAGIHFHPHPIDWLHFESNFSMVLAEDKEGNPLPLIPQSKLNTRLRAELPHKHKIGISDIYLQHIYKFEQNRTGLFETPTPAWQIVNAGLTVRFAAGHGKGEISTGIKNVFNANYIDHLSRFKYLGISNPGRNYYLSLKIEF